jgi:hypothetical protein
LAPKQGDWIALFIHDREISHKSSAAIESAAVTGRVSIRLPSTEGYYDVRMYAKNKPPVKGENREILKSAPFLIGQQVAVRVVFPVEGGGEGEGNGEDRSMRVVYQLPAAAKEGRTDSIRLYAAGTRSNRVCLSAHSVIIPEGTTEGELVLHQPYIPGRYEFRYFANNAKHEYCGISVPFSVADRDYLTVTVDDCNVLHARWGLFSCDPSTFSVLNPMCKDWVELVAMPEATRVTYQWIARKVKTDEVGEETFDLNDKAARGVNEFAVRLYCHRQKDFIRQSETVARNETI